MKTCITILCSIAACMALDACKRTESAIVSKSQETRAGLDARGVLSAVDWSEEHVDKFFADNRGKPIADILKILGEPRIRKDHSTKTSIHYVIEGRVRNAAIHTEFSGFSLAFDGGSLKQISKEWGYQPD